MTKATLSATLAILLGAVTGPCWAVDPEMHQVPFDETLSVSAVCAGTWKVSFADGPRTRDLEATVHAFAEGDEIPDELYYRSQYLIVSPPPPPQWFFFGPVPDHSISLRLRVRDLKGRLGKAVVKQWSSGEEECTILADEGGHQLAQDIDIWCTVEALVVQLLDVNGRLLAKLMVQVPHAEEAVIVCTKLGWLTSYNVSYDSPHPPMPYSEASDTAEQGAVIRPHYGRGSWGPWPFHNDTPNEVEVPAPPTLVWSRVVRDCGDNFDADWLPPQAGKDLKTAIESTRNLFAQDKPCAPPYKALPFTEGDLTWSASCEATCFVFSIMPYRGLRLDLAQAQRHADFYTWGEIARNSISESTPNRDPAEAVRAALAERFANDKLQWLQITEPLNMGEVWTLKVTTEPTCNAEVKSILAPLTFVLRPDKPFPPRAAAEDAEVRGKLVRGEPWTMPAPPMYGGRPQGNLIFPRDGDQKGVCTLELPKGWNWTASVTWPSTGYSEAVATTGPIALDGPATLVLDTKLEKLLELRVKTIPEGGSETGPSEPCLVELYTSSHDFWSHVNQGTTSAQGPDGAQVWTAVRLIPGYYRLRARSAISGQVCPWSPWAVLNVTPDVRREVTLVVPRPQPPPDRTNP